MKTINQKLFEIKKLRITLTRDTKAFNYKYATLDQIQEKINPLLEEHNLLVTHYINNNELITKITNLDDEKDFVVSSIGLGDLLKAQDKGSAITYYRRYNLLSLFDLEVEDDDGAKASQIKEVKERFVFGVEQLEKFKKDRNKHKEKLNTYSKALTMIADANYSITKEVSDLLKQWYDEIYKQNA